MKIEYPSYEKKEQSIAFIKSQTKRKRVSSIQFLINSYKEIGLSVILRKSYKVYALSVVIFSALLIYALSVLDGQFRETGDITDILMLFFMVSPFVLLLTDGLYQLQERPFDTYEMQNTHKYTARHLILLRMPLFSFGAILLNFLLAFAWCFRFGFSYLLSLTAVIASSVLFYSLINIIMFNRFKLGGPAFTIVFWIAMNVVIYKLNNAAKLFLFTSVPVAIHIVAALLMLAAFVLMVKRAYQKPVCRVTQ